MKKVRAASFAAAAIAIVAGILLIPTPLRVQGTLVFKAAKPQVIYAEVPGILKEMPVRDGQWVEKGALIAKLSNPEKIRERETLQEQGKSSFAKAAYFGVSHEPESRALRLQHEQMSHDLEKAINEVNDQIAKLTLYADRDGEVIGLPHPETVGQYLKPGKPFCEVADPHRLEAHMILDQADRDLIRVDGKAWIKVYGDSETTWRSKVGAIAERNREEIPPELANTAGGEIATKQDPKTGQAKPLSAVYEVIIPIDNPDLAIQPGLRGFAKIDGGTRTFGWWLWRLINKTFHFTL